MKSVLFAFLLLSCFASAQIEFKHGFEDNIKPVLALHEKQLSSNKFIIYCSQYVLFLYIADHDNIYKYHYNLKSNVEGSKLELLNICVIEDPIVSELFNYNNYVKGYIDNDSEFYKTNEIKISNGPPIYFSINDSLNSNYATYILAFMRNPVPIQKDIWWYISFGHHHNNTCMSIVDPIINQHVELNNKN